MMDRSSGLLLLALLSACGGKEEEPYVPVEEPASEPEPAAEEPADEEEDTGQPDTAAPPPDPPVDADGDGYPEEEDCDDGDPELRPDATEVCDGLDNDCDGLVDDADDSLELGTASVFYADGDGDGFGDAGADTLACEQPEASVADATDCDDNDPAAYPGAEETAGDGIDQDCDGEDAILDADEDGFSSIEDCDDGDAAVNPGAPEVPADGLDNNCDGVETCYVDGDGDGYGSSADSDGDGTPDSIPSADMYCDSVLESDNLLDCNDSDADVNPDATDDDADGVDQNCDGYEYCYVDTDADGFGSTFTSPTTDVSCSAAGFSSNSDDCNDTVPDGVSIYPGAEEVVGDGIDQDCDGADIAESIEDGDSDGFYNTVDCDDEDSFTHPGAAENESDPTACMTDADGDGYGDTNPTASGAEPGTDCDDQSLAIYPYATDIEDGIDNDCDGSVDNPVQGGTGTDLDGDGWAEGLDCDDSDSDTFPGAAENEQDPTLCMTDSDDDGYGDSSPGSPDADPGTDCDDLNWSISPQAADLEDGIDNDCDGSVDNPGAGGGPGNGGQGDADGDGFDSTSDCNDADASIFPGAEELPDGLDNDCNGQVDDGLVSDQDGDGFDSTLDCDDGNPDVYPGNAASESVPGCYQDADADGYGDGSPGDPDVDAGTDCSDEDGAVHPGAVEVPDGLDNDCDGTVDNVDLGTGSDVDGDGWNESADCDDSDADTFPGSAENEDDSTSCMTDSDGDGYGDSDSTGAVAAGTDCDDADGAVNPAAEETEDGLDNDCSGEVDDIYYDEDGDGFEAGEDCNDYDAFTYPGVAESEPDPTLCMRDEDGDGYGDAAPLNPDVEPGSDCDDLNPLVNPGALDIEDGQDNDCSGVVDDGSDVATLEDVGIGDLIITEIMNDPSSVQDDQGEWFEIYNLLSYDVDLNGLNIADLDNNSHTISSTLVISAESYFVFGNNADTTSNGGAPVDYSYGIDIGLGNSEDEIIIQYTDISGSLIEFDSVAFDGGTTFPAIPGVSMNLNPNNYSHYGNDTGSNWCASTDSFGLDMGTPGQVNSSCTVGEEDICDDEVDNDGDGDTDCEDPDCVGTDSCPIPDEIETCDDGIDNDGDGLVDCDDDSCIMLPFCTDAQEICDDGDDNDLDNFIDCDDADCTGSVHCSN
jgi:hypothetical protein